MRAALIRKLAGAVALSSMAFSFPALAGNEKDKPLLMGAPVSDIRSPYDVALKCLAGVLTEDQKRTTFSVGFFQDLTGKTNYVSDSGTGMFSTQGSEAMLYSSLWQTGVQVVDTSMQNRAMLDWTLAKLQGNLKAGSEMNVALILPDVSVSGAITTFDINVSSGGAGIRIAGIGGSRSKNRILVGMDARLIEMAGGPGKAGRQVAATRINKQIVGYQNEAGATSFFGGGSATLFEIDLGTRQSEAIQYMERIMLDRVAFDLVSDYFGVRACDEHRAYGDSLAIPK